MKWGDSHPLNTHSQDSADMVTVPKHGSRSTTAGNTWTVIEFTPQGNVKLVEFMRSDLYTKFGLQGRDVRVLISNMNYPTVLARQKCIIADIKNISGIIAGDRFLLIRTENSDPAFVKLVQSELKYHHMGREGIRPLVEGADGRMAGEHSFVLPFEFIILECILHRICSDLKKELEQYKKEVNDIISSPSLGSSEQILFDIMKKRQELNRFTTFVRELHESIENLLQSDEDMASMYLSEKMLYGKSREVNKHEEVEMLLENYYTQLEDILNRIEELKSDIQSTQEFIEICLDSIRNRMIQLELRLSIASLSLTSGTLVAGLFGMNLMSHLENNPFAFYYMTFGILSFAGGMFIITLLRARKHGIFDFKYVSALKRKLTNHNERKDQLKSNGIPKQD
ncbi:mitochondrial inner membrane magnesium transporter [Acrasis kona]|uniref:Magnesium transporter n=1 Tax=Acrasis kona TaxID=1008807 RepID=A0AAW2YJX2_9EUKA